HIDPITERGLCSFDPVLAANYEIREVPQFQSRKTAPVHAITELASAVDNGNAANDSSEEISISGDGRYIAFSSSATDLVPGDTNNAKDIFVFDRQLRRTERV